MRTLVLPVLWILAVGTLMGLAANALRETDQIELGRAYFAALAGDPGPAGPGVEPGPGSRTNGKGGLEVKPARLVGPPIYGDSELLRRAAAEFEILTLFEAYDWWQAAVEDPQRIVFVDSREDSRFLDGHIPDALQLDYYNIRRVLGPTLPFLQKLKWIVIYCESVGCDDGFLLCKILSEEYGIPKERLRLFFGGMKQWREWNLPEVKGRTTLLRDSCLPVMKWRGMR